MTATIDRLPTMEYLRCYNVKRGNVGKTKQKDKCLIWNAFGTGAVRFDQAVESGSCTKPSKMSMMLSVPTDVRPSDTTSIDCR